jgi:hypothetical protein
MYADAVRCLGGRLRLDSDSDSDLDLDLDLELELDLDLDLDLDVVTAIGGQTKLRLLTHMLYLYMGGGGT